MRSPVLNHSGLLLPIVAGIVLAVIATMLLSVVQAKWLIVGCLGLLGLIPALVVRDATVYWLVLFVMSLPFEITKNLLDGYFRAQETFENLGAPPYGGTGLKLYLSDLPFIMLLALWFARIALRKETINLPPIAILVLVWLLVITFTSIAVAEHPKLSFIQLFRQYKYFLIFLFLINVVPTRGLLNVLLITLLATLAVEGSVTIARYQIGSAEAVFGGFFGERDAESLDTVISVDDAGTGKIRSVGTFGHPAGAAVYLALLLPFAIVYFFIAQDRFRRLLYMALIGLGLLGMAVTFSRSAMAAFVAGAGLVTALSLFRGAIPRKLRTLTVFAAISVMLMGTPMLYKYLTTRPEAAQYRLFLLEAAGKMFVANPVVGVGLANSTAVKPQYLRSRQLADDEKYAIHNNHAVMLVETGLLGYVLLGIVCICFFRRALRLSRSDDPFCAGTGYAILTSYCIAFIYMFGDNLAGNAHNSLMWIFCALVVILEKRGVYVVDEIRPLNSVERPKIYGPHLI